MSMRKIVCGLAAAAAAGAIAQEQGGASAERGGSARFGNWRLTVGPAMNVGVKAKLRARPAAIAGHMPAFVRPTGISSEEAAANAAQGKYDNGAFINPDSSVELVGQTWNWWAPESAYDGSKLTFRNAYVDTSSAETAMGLGDKDDHVVPGVTAELSRNLFHDEERNWGLDISGLVSWYKRDKILKAGGERYSRTDTTDAGEYVTEYENGEERLLNILNSKTFTSSKEICDTVKEDLDKFVGDADQFDDITMVALRFIGKPPAPEIRFEEAKIDDIRGLNLATAGSINNGSMLTSMRTVMAAIQNYGRY